MSKAIQKDLVKKFLLDFQKELCAKYSLIETNGQDLNQFEVDTWEHKNGGGGITRVLSNGTVFERAGINFSHVLGNNLPTSATVSRPYLAGGSFEAMGISSVIHPRNPYVPTSHINLRLFLVNTKEGETVWWFGGGFDLTPYYANLQDCIHWHTQAKTACMPYGGVYIYEKFKNWCDDYFYLKHRDEHRGIGGLFFDDLNEWGFEITFDFLKAVGQAYIDAYIPIIERNNKKTYTDHQKQFQLYRRGRYVEFNLLFDRGTIFGIQSKGRTESILVSLPPAVNWRYNWQAKEGTEEYLLTDFYLKPQDWLALEQSGVPIL